MSYPEALEVGSLTSLRVESSWKYHSGGYFGGDRESAKSERGLPIHKAKNVSMIWVGNRNQQQENITLPILVCQRSKQVSGLRKLSVFLENGHDLTQNLLSCHFYLLTYGAKIFVTAWKEYFKGCFYEHVYLLFYYFQKCLLCFIISKNDSFCSLYPVILGANTRR